MGGGPSNTRKITVVNNDQAGVIKISESVAQRIRGEQDSTQDKPRAEPTSQTSSPPLPPPTPTPVPKECSTFNSLQQKEAQHEALQQAEASWRSRLAELERQNKELYDVARDKFSEGITRVEQAYVNRSCAVVCPEKQNDVLKCYTENVRYPLNCSNEVKSFVKCVDEVRREVIINRG